MFQLRKSPSDRLLELGGGGNPCIPADGDRNVCVDVRMTDDAGNRLPVNFTADFNEPLPIGDQEFDGVVTRFTIEHLSWRKVRSFVSEIHRVLKGGGRLLIITANTEAQFEWIKERGFDKQDPKDRKGGEFEDCSCLIFGDQDYPENTHRNYLSPALITGMLSDLGFRDIQVQPYGALGTDMVVECVRSLQEANISPSTIPAHLQEECGRMVATLKQGEIYGAYSQERADESRQLQHATSVNPPVILTPVSETVPNPLITKMEPPTEADEWLKRCEETPPQEKFSRRYFDGGHPVWGGYAGGGYWDFPCHEITFRHVLAREPGSVLELGCARGHVLKRLQDHGVRACGLEVSRHCWMTRACDGIIEWDITQTPWPFKDKEFELAYSLGCLDHIPLKHIENVVREMIRVSCRSLHGIGFTPADQGDRTRCLVRDQQWWIALFWSLTKDLTESYHYQILDKGELEQGEFPKEVIEGDGRLKLNLGSFTTMFHHGWLNMDVHDLKGYAESMQFKYKQWDVRNGLPFSTGVVDLIYSSHMLEHLTYDEGIRLLRECRRVVRQDGAMRIIVPNAAYLTSVYSMDLRSWEGGKPGSLRDFDHINETCEKAPTIAGKLHAMLYSGGHQALYDAETLCQMLNESGWEARESKFRGGMCEPWSKSDHPALKQILKETIDMLPCLSLYISAVPRIV